MKELTRMGKKMDYIMGGIIMDRSGLKVFTRMGKRMDYILLGIKMERKKKK